MEAVNTKTIVLDVTEWPKVSQRSSWVNDGLDIRLSTAVKTVVKAKVWQRVAAHQWAPLL